MNTNGFPYRNITDVLK